MMKRSKSQSKINLSINKYKKSQSKNKSLRKENLKNLNYSSNTKFNSIGKKFKKPETPNKISYLLQKEKSSTKIKTDIRYNYKTFKDKIKKNIEPKHIKFDVDANDEKDNKKNNFFDIIKNKEKKIKLPLKYKNLYKFLKSKKLKDKIIHNLVLNQKIKNKNDFMRLINRNENNFIKIKNNKKVFGLKLDKNKIKRIKEKINLIKFRFSNMKKCPVYNFFYTGNKKKKLQESKIENNNDNNDNIEQIKLLEKSNENLKSEKIDEDNIDEDIVNIGDISHKEDNIEEKANINLKISVNLSINSIHKIIQINYPEIKQTKKIKINSPICDKCFRLVYIFFDYIKDYITTYCSYCENILIYKYDTFINKIQENKSPLLDCTCSNCYKSFLYSENNNPFVLIEKRDKNFIVLCKNCFIKNENSKEKKENEKIINFDDLIEQKLFIYEKNNNIRNNINNNENNNNIIIIKKDNNNININDINFLEKNSEIYDKKIKDLLFILKGYENNIKLLESKITDIPFSIKDNFYKKLKTLNKNLLIKKTIQNYYNEFNNFVTRINMLSSLNTILNLISLRLYRLNFININLTVDDKYLISKNFLKCEDLSHRFDIPEIKYCYSYKKLTKNFLNEEEYIQDKNHSTEEILKISYSDILNINYIIGKGIKYDISSENCYCEKIVPLTYSYNLKYNSINYQDILLYNFRNDKKIYYAQYNIERNTLESETLKLLINEPINNCDKIILINNGLDLFILSKERINFFKEIYYAYYIYNFRENHVINKYEINDKNNIIYNDYTICIQTKKKLMIINREIKKDINIFPEHNNINNINENNLVQEYVEEDNNIIDNENENNNAINNNNNIQDEINNIIEFQDNLINAFGGDLDEFFENLDEINNGNLPPVLSSSVFQVNEQGIKCHFLDTYKIDEKYFVVLSSKKVKKINSLLKIYFYLSLFDFEKYEEISKIEFEMLEFEENNKFNSHILKDNDSFKIIINISNIEQFLEERIYNFTLENGELLEIN